MKKRKPKIINDLPPTQSLDGVKFRHPETGETCFFFSQWNKGVWYKKDPKSQQIFPLFVDDLKDVLKFELAE